MLFLKSLDERRVGIAFPYQQIQSGRFLGAGTSEDRDRQQDQQSPLSRSHSLSSTAALKTLAECSPKAAMSRRFRGFSIDAVSRFQNKSCRLPSTGILRLPA